MHKPRMILFDYAHTLLYEPETDFLRGEEAVFRHVKHNPRQITPQEAAALGTELFLSARPCRHSGWELHEHQQLRLKYDLLNLTFDLPMAQLEDILWTASSPGAPMPGVQEMLAGVRARGVRTGVISNLGWTGEALTARLKRLLPEHDFEFVIASSDYGVRKPDPLIFRAALSKAALPPEDVWFCGDQVEADVCGAQDAGLFPVWYEEQSIPNGFSHKNAGLTITGRHLHIHRWYELLSALDHCE
ncbi:MAG: HAD family hydrolase [Clostridia bacterium]|nr:HAD family hydrolase [Clostridia bacterium]